MVLFLALPQDVGGVAGLQGLGGTADRDRDGSKAFGVFGRGRQRGEARENSSVRPLLQVLRIKLACAVRSRAGDLRHAPEYLSTPPPPQELPGGKNGAAAQPQACSRSVIDAARGGGQNGPFLGSPPYRGRGKRANPLRRRFEPAVFKTVHT